MRAQIWLTQVGGAAPRADLLQPVKNRAWPHNKPEYGGGLWTSSETSRRGLCDWWRWCKAEQWGSNPVDAYRLTVTDAARVYVVDSCDSLRELVARFPHHDQHRGTAHVDWEAAAREFDGVNLTESAQWETRFVNDPPLGMYGWDCESTLWFRWSFVSVEYVGKRRSRTSEGLTK